MSIKIPQISGNDAISKLKKIGYYISRQRGSHARLVSDDSNRKKFTVPLHKILKKGTLNQIIKDAGLTLQEFLNL